MKKFGSKVFFLERIWLLILLSPVDSCFQSCLLCTCIWMCLLFIVLKITCEYSLRPRMKMSSFSVGLSFLFLRYVKVSLTEEYFKRISQLEVSWIRSPCKPRLQTLPRLVWLLRDLYPQMFYPPFFFSHFFLG